MAKENKDKRKLKNEPRLKLSLSEEQKQVKAKFYEYDVNLVHGDFGCLSKGTKVIMYNGTLKNVEDVIVGDKLMGPDSKSRTVLELKRGVQQMYWVHQNRGISYRVNESHILSLKKVDPARHSRKTLPDGKRILDKTKPLLKNRKVGTVNLSVKDYIDTPESFKIKTQGYIPEQIEWEERELPIDPYYLGLWLGDGSSNNNDITNVDYEIISWLKLFSEESGLTMNKKVADNRVPVYSFTDDEATWKKPNRLTKKFRDLDLYHNKHIPYIYKTSSINQRMQLLAGLIDSDGYYDNKGKRYEITQNRLELIEDIGFICRSLGFRTKISPKKATMKRKDGSMYERGVYRLMFSPDKQIPVKLQRKRYENNREICKNQRHTNITIEKDVVDKYYGFTLDGDHLFLLEDFTVTHNSGKTLVACAIALSAFRKKEFNKIVIARPIVKNNVGFLPGDISAKLQPFVAPIVHNFNMLQSPVTTEKMLSDLSIEILPVDFAKGITYVESVVIVDEYEDLDYEDFRMMLSRLGRNSKIIFCGSKEQIHRSIGKQSCINQTMKLEESGLVGYSTLKENHRNAAIKEITDFLEK